MLTFCLLTAMDENYTLESLRVSHTRANVTPSPRCFQPTNNFMGLWDHGLSTEGVEPRSA